MKQQALRSAGQRAFLLEFQALSTSQRQAAGKAGHFGHGLTLTGGSINEH
jgi:hypothetical protein